MPTKQLTSLDDLLTKVDLVLADTCSDPAETLAIAEELSSLRALLKRLPPRIRIALRMRYGFQGSACKYRAIASRLGCSDEYARQLVANGLVRLRQLMC